MIEPMFGYIWEIPFLIGMIFGMGVAVLGDYLLNRWKKWKNEVRKAEMYYNGATWTDEKKNL